MLSILMIIASLELTNLVMHELALQDDQLLFSESRLLSLLPQLVQLLVLEQTSPENDSKKVMASHKVKKRIDCVLHAAKPMLKSSCTQLSSKQA